MTRSLSGVVRRTWLVLAALVWAAAVLALHLLEVTDGATTVVLGAAGLLVAGLAQVNRWHRHLLRLLTEQRQRLDELDAAAERSNTALDDGLRSVRGRVDELAGDVVGPRELEQAVDNASHDSLQRIRKAMSGDLMRAYHQLEALQNLYAVSGVDRPLPPARDWACSPDLLLFLVDLVDHDRPRLIVECGSGLSTLWFAKALRRFEIHGRVVALEHLESHADRTRDLVTRHGLADLVEIRQAELEEFEVDGETYRWYSRKTWDDLTDIDLLFVDGPPAETNPNARYPALPLLTEQLHPDAAVVLDDMVRKEEQHILARWLEHYPTFDSEPVRLEKHAALLRREHEGGRRRADGAS